MSYQERLDLYRKIENLRGYPLICYVTNIRPHASGLIASDVIPEFIKQIKEVSAEHNEVDLLLASNGGDAIAAVRIIGLLRERFRKISVLIPYVAFSAATLIALGADEIIMHPFSNLGPVDPQLTLPRPAGGRLHVGVEDLRNYFTFVKSEVGIAGQEEITRVFELLCNEVGPTNIGFAKRSAQLATDLGEKLLGSHMVDEHQAKAITAHLSRSYHDHGYPLRRLEAKEIGLPIVPAPRELEENMWLVWEDLEKEMECNTNFDPSDAALEDPRVVQLLDTEQMSDATVLQINYELFLSTLESSRGRSEFKNRGRIVVEYQPPMNIDTSMVQLYQGWTYTKTSE